MDDFFSWIFLHKITIQHIVVFDANVDDFSAITFGQPTT
jgi:hypothetical protein